MDNDKFQRDAFFDKLYELALVDKDLVIVVADMSAEALDKFRLKLPTQYINVGIAEQNAIQISAGLSLAGKKVFVYAIASFLALRALEQIRVSIGVMNIPITIVGMGVGFSYQSDGPTHHLIEDVSILRSIPNIKIVSITDSNMASKAAEDAYYNTKGTTYIRLDKDKSECFYAPNESLSDGLKEIISSPNKDIVLLTNGTMTHTGKKVATALSEKGVDISVVDVYNIPINSQKLLEEVSNAKQIFTLEEHFINGGLGSAVCEVLSDNQVFIPTYRIGVKANNSYKFCYTYGGRNNIRKAVGIDVDSVVKTILDNLKQ